MEEKVYNNLQGPGAETMYTFWLTSWIKLILMLKLGSQKCFGLMP